MTDISDILSAVDIRSCLRPCPEFLKFALDKTTGKKNA